MPNHYHYFESGEVSYERLLLEIELLKQLREADLLQNLDWSSYDTSALKLFLQAGIQEVNDEINQRSINNSNKFEHDDFIHQCIEKHSESSKIEDNFKPQRFSFPLILNTIFILICLSFVIGLFIYQYIKYNHQHPLFSTLKHPLTTKRRHLIFTDDLSLILLTFTTALILASTILATRYNRQIILFGIIALILIIIFLFIKCHQIITFLSKYRELRWSILDNYMYS